MFKSGSLRNLLLFTVTTLTVRMPHCLGLLRVFPALLILLCLLPVATVAQDLDNVTISGRITDQNGAVVPGTTLMATLIKTKTERMGVADEEGRYKIIQLAPGIYSVKAS